MARLSLVVSLVVVLTMRMSESRNTGASLDWDASKGYVLYCPCSGRFTGQVEQFLGAVQFAKAVGRILVAPPFIMYPCGRKDRHDHFGVQVPIHMDRNAYVAFDEYFEMEEIKKYYPNVITMETFMTELAPLYWKEGNRFAYCSSGLADNNDGKCTRDGNPFRTFWEDQGIIFDESTVWRTESTSLHYNIDATDTANEWKKEFPASEHPVLALMTAPTYTPISPKTEGLQHYLKFTSIISEPADLFIEKSLQRPFWGLHLRNGADWSRTCELAKDYPHLLSSRQCTREEDDSVTKQMCIHSEEEVISDIRSQIYLAEETDRELPKTIFVATDHVAMEEELQAAFPDIKIVAWGPDLDQMDLHILNQADHVILNCVSAFSAYVKRDRDVNEKSVAFFGYMETHKKLPVVKRSPFHEEL
ncbi:GDP-fucose protein O-fucosyltransferase 1-like isoform X1 [Asterias rubens]|uniref:GDP-fucose protein O-fucosyltransferase 1-like isoform X1 n=1 Tax=Asterias rubens TaxID=7604 RepID=UPI001455C879|nr:GDP-fucose protein O-fucosyltransferase 1-like isoform X1 [Asterias rubens]